MDYDNYLDRIGKSQDIDMVYAGLVSLLPFFPLSLKLLERKNRGKKPFSSAFGYEGKRKEIEKTKELLEKTLDKKDSCPDGICERLDGFVSILAEAKEEIRNEGLKKDFDYMISEVKTVVSLMKGK